MFLTISFIMDKVLYTSAASASIHNFVNVPLLCAILGDDRSWPGRFSVREEKRVVGDVSFEEVCMKAGEGVGIVWEFKSVFGAFRECMGNGVGAVMSRHKFGYPCFAFSFVILAAIFGGEHDKVTNLIDIFWCSVFIGMVGLADLGSKEIVLCLLNIKGDPGDDFMCSCLFSSCIFSEGNERRNDAGRSPSLQLEARETSGCIHGIHNGKSYVGEFGQPSLLVVINMVPDGLVHGLVGSFTTTISFGMV